MGKGCQFEIGKNGTVTNVFADNGEKSILFKEAQKITSNEDALKIWGVAQTNSFKEVFNGLSDTTKDKNDEPSLKSVMNYIQANNNQTGLTPAEAAQVKTALVNTDFKNSTELARALKSAFIPAPTKESLQKSGMYSPVEIAGILASPDIISGVQNLVYKIQLSDEIANDLYANDAFKTTSTYQKDIIGKSLMDNPYVNEQETIQELGGIKDRNEFEQALEGSDFDYLKTQAGLFSFFASFNNVPQKEIVDGELKDKPKNDTKGLFVATLKEPSNSLLEQALDALEGISPVVWESSPAEISVLVSNARKEAAKIGLDLTGLESKSQDEVLSLTRALNLLVGDATIGNLSHLAEVYDSVYATDVSPARIVIQVDAKFRDKNIVSLKENNRYKMFNEHGLLAIGKNSWIQTDALKKDLSQVYDSIYANVKINQNIFPQDTFSANINDRELALTDMRKFVETKLAQVDTTGSAYNREALEKMILYAQFFGADITAPKEKTDFQKEAGIADLGITNTEYLKSEFLSDLRVAQITAKDDIYKNIRITPEGAEIINDDPISMQDMQVFFDSDKGENLKNYLLLKKDSPAIEVEPEEVTVQSERDAYRNFPQALQPYMGDYTALTGKVVEIKGQGDFVRISNKVYEKIQDNIYGELTTNESQFREFGASRPEVGEISKSSVNSAPEVTIKNLYSQEEKEQIEEELDECS